MADTEVEVGGLTTSQYTLRQISLIGRKPPRRAEQFTSVPFDLPSNACVIQSVYNGLFIENQVRDIVDTSTHASCAVEHNPTKQVTIPTT